MAVQPLVTPLTDEFLMKTSAIHRRVIGGCVTLALIATTAAGARPASGAGGQTCASFVRHAGRQGLADRPALQWVLGYLTGRGHADPVPPHMAFRGPEGVALDTLRYCRTHPKALLDDAASHFFELN